MSARNSIEFLAGHAISCRIKGKLLGIPDNGVEPAALRIDPSEGHRSGEITVVATVAASKINRNKFTVSDFLRGSPFVRQCSALTARNDRFKCIGLGTVLGAILEKSGGAKALTAKLLGIFGERGAPVAMGLLGVHSLAQLDASYLHPAAPVTLPQVTSAFPLLDLDDEGLQIDVPLFVGPIVGAASDAAASFTDGELMLCRWVFSINTFYNWATNQFGQTNQNPMHIVAGGPDLWTQLIVIGTPTIAALNIPVLGITVVPD